MPSTRISTHARDTLRALAQSKGEPMQELLEKAIESYRRQCILEESNRAFAALRADHKAWNEEEKDRRMLEVTLLDGLEEEE